MPNPTRYTAGISTFPVQHIQNTYPATPTQNQVVKSDDFIPFRQSTDYTATTSTGGTAAAFSWNGGAVRITGGTTTPFKSFQALGANSLQIVPGNQVWMDIRTAVPTGTMQNPLTDSVVYSGYFDNVDPTAATNGIYFIKPAGGSTINFVVLKNGTSTTFTNVGDFSKPSGIYGDASSYSGSLTFNTTGTTFSSVTVSSGGSGYRCAPLCLPYGTAGTGAQVYAQLGGATQGAGAPGGGVYAPYITAAGSGYTAGTLGCDLVPWINLQIWYNGKGTICAGINGRCVLSLGKDGNTTAVPGSTYNLATVGTNNFAFNTTTLSTGVAPVQPFPGDFYVAAPQVPLQLAFGLVGSANTRYLYVEEINIGTELY